MYLFLVPPLGGTIKIEAIVAVLIGVGLVVKSRNCIPLMVAMIFVTYCIYSIVMGEYIATSSHLGVPLTEVRTQEIYSTTLRILLLFLSIIFIFFPKKINHLFILKPKDNIFIFSFIIMILVYIGIFGIDRTVQTHYMVRISSLYEYSVILFLFAYYSSGNKLVRKTVIGLLMIAFIFQDYYYGGRITSLQIILLAISTLLNGMITKKLALIGSIVGIFVNSLVGVYRNLIHFDFIAAFLNLKNQLFVFDTPVYAYYASATHVATINYTNISLSERFQSAANFICSIFLGSEENSGNITKYVNDHYYINVGGGIFPTHFYFWFGWLGVILSALIVVGILKITLKTNNTLTMLISISIITTIPRWFLYTPLSLFRNIFLISIFYCLFILGYKFTTQTSIRLSH
ncbi:hypothetical protein QQG09_04645 [Melissococcus plutonius]|uniref:Uncharacterized protein n=2 Tax=Melissococcus plutonius TaxID=33970 RepID=A0A2Z5Y3U5_9ENTE|nr:hypothetical protein [Melissococcus plutonius]MCV2498515.1 hypothetical protein [Melissococcus plutonius]MCV2501074.1 hypothetical protein [Melissococcus plutonius]MCV2504816.1 hypothetical protein [Melissococcus plutonius]MCV2507277.1 hypothetical protein [Melissococcus plutonius]MCV2519222.1 hypothetical protein [Melissococcus plutonius]